MNRMGGQPSAAAVHDLEWGWVKSPNGWMERAAILVCCLSCHRDEPEDSSTPDDPHGLIAPFARRNYYATAVSMMRCLLARLDQELGIPRKSARIFCNSRMPEKALCVAAGLASVGRNGLCISPGLGSLFVIAGAVIPRPLAESIAHLPEPPRDLCGNCHRCIEACPTQAITSAGFMNRELCLQNSAARPVDVPPEVMEKWGKRLYGCQDCQSVCPHNRGPIEEGPQASGEIGPSVSLAWFLSLGRPDRDAFLRGTSLGVSWISRDGITRNAIIAAGNGGTAALRRRIAPYLGSGSRTLRAAASWAMERLTRCVSTPGERID